MSKSVANSTKKPGKRVRAKSGLNKSILDQDWFDFRRQLDYKLAWNGDWLVAVPPAIPVEPVHAAAMCRRITARYKPVRL